MKTSNILVFLMMIAIAANSAYSFQATSSNYKLFPLIVSSGGEIVNSSNYKNYVATGIVAGVISSPTYKNFLGFFYGWKLADGQPCASADQCEGGYCCSSACRSSSCPIEEAAGAAGAAGAAEGAGGAGGFPAVEIKDFSVSPSSIKAKLVLGRAAEETLTIENTGRATLEFSLSVEGVKDYLFLSDDSFELGAGESKRVTVNFIGKDVGSFVGQIIVKGDGIQRSVPIIIEVISEIILFDVKLDVPHPEVYPGEKLETQVTLINAGAPEKVDALVTYLIKDLSGAVIYEESETFAVKTQISYPKWFKIDKGTAPGDYVVVAEVRYADSFAVSSQLFKVLEMKPIAEMQVVAKNTMKILLLLLVLILVLSLLIYMYAYKRKRESRKFVKCYRLLLAAEDALDENDKNRARELYIKAREAYAGLERIEKKEIYSKFMKVYNRLYRMYTLRKRGK